MTISNGNNGGVMQFGDTTLTKVFVGGLAWETPKEALREHFEKFGDILEAVIISDKTTGKSKGYGFVTFKNPEAANKACEDPTPVINGRRANCNLASLGARRPSKHQPPNNTPHHPQPQQGSVNGGQRAQTATPPPPPPPNQVQWYYPGAGTPPAPFHHHQHHQAIPFYAYARYSPAYIATDVSYNHKVNYNGGCYVNGQYSQMYPGQPIGGAAAAGTNTLMPIYPLYHFHHQSHTMGLPAPPHHIIPSVTGPPPLPTVPTIISKPPSMAPTSGTVVVGKGESF